ncbi:MULTISPECIES: DUF7224 domain-containing protein [Streptosporangium]|uniref:DUF7224 domain-containing protein n=1 Tax=Streptosporangium brasiliense TaxID=47480 RepID=A0ABT9R2Q7_9ACTN|nr:hypothetical protein [Streptosporangium brasiliense]MDP9863518.1 hypothetical protein [Streptosporangium brasiliense]
MRWMIWVELRRSSAKWAFLLLLALGGGLMTVWGQGWYLVWPEASVMAANAATYFAAAVLAGMAAWSAQRDVRQAMRDQLTVVARRSWQVEGAHLSATLIYAWSGIAVFAVVAAVVAAGPAGAGFLWTSYLLLVFTTLTVCVASGHVAGRLWPSRITPPLTAVTVLVIQFLTPTNAPFDFSVVTGPARLELSTGVLVARCFFALGIVALAVLTPSMKSRTESSRTRPLVLLASVVGLLGWVVLSGPLQVARTPPVKPLCAKPGAGVPTVCLWPENHAYLGAASEAARRISDAAGDAIPLPKAYYDGGLKPDGGGYPYFTALPEVEAISASMALSGFLPPGKCPDASDAAMAARYDIGGRVWVWHAAVAKGANRVSDDDSFILPPEVAREVDTVLAKPRAEQLAWVKNQVKRTWAGCDG